MEANSSISNCEFCNKGITYSNKARHIARCKKITKPELLSFKENEKVKKHNEKINKRIADANKCWEKRIANLEKQLKV